MCGILAWLDLASSKCAGLMSRADVEEALKAMHHRGPDGYGVWNSADNNVGLGHVRLSIIDLAGGGQPLSDETGSIWAVVNGEFYDFERIRSELIAVGHTFKTHSDSEILVHLYKSKGLECLQTLRGEFAFCLWDSTKSSLFVGRDRFGAKPLYYTHVQGRLLIASEIKAFLSLGWQPEWDVDSVMNSKAFFENKTLFRGVFNLEAGHYLTATKEQGIMIKKYWAPEYPETRTVDVRTDEEMIEGVRQRLLDAVRVRMRSDVPVCLYLSGGVDSSTILGMATSVLKETQPGESVHAFTISFADDNDGKYDESLIAERSANHFGAVFHKLSLSEQALSDAFEESVWHWEMPMVDFCSVAKYLLSKFVRESGFKVVLVGEGSDEHFSGYEAFHIDYMREGQESRTKSAFTNAASTKGGLTNGALPNGVFKKSVSTNGTWIKGSVTNTISPNGVVTTGVGTNGVGANGAVTNGAATNGAATNGVATNGAVTNGAATNGVASNGAAMNGGATNGVAINGAAANGVAINGVALNGAAANGVSTNGALTNGAVTNKAATNGAVIKTDSTNGSATKEPPVTGVVAKETLVYGAPKAASVNGMSTKSTSVNNSLIVAGSANAALTESIIAAKLATIENDEAEPDWCAAFGCLPLSYKDSVEARALINGISTHRVITTMLGYPRGMFTSPAVYSAPELPDPCMTIARACAPKINPKWHKMHQAMAVWNATFFPELCLLHEGDRSEMANSIEGRLPYLDTALVEYVNNLPPEVKYRHPTDKWILREASRPYVTDEIYSRKKFAYVAPPAVNKPGTARCRHGELLRARLTRSAIDLLGWASWDFVEEMFLKYENHNDRLAHNNLNALLSMVVIAERFKVKTWQPQQEHVRTIR